MWYVGRMYLLLKEVRDFHFSRDAGTDFCLTFYPWSEDSKNCNIPLSEGFRSLVEHYSIQCGLFLTIRTEKME
jgi:hypothetical protein